MPRPGLHPIMRPLTVVLRNGASVTVASAGRARGPVVLSVVRASEEEGGGEGGGLCRRLPPPLPLLLECQRRTGKKAGGGAAAAHHSTPSFVSTQSPFPPPPLSPVSFVQDPTVHPRWTGDASAVASEDGRLAKFTKKFAGGLGGGAAKGGE
jgi:ribosomal protein L31